MSLPSIYKNKIDEDIRNSQYTYYGKDNNRNEDILNDLPVDAWIETNQKSFKARIVGKTNNYLITSLQEVINIKDCLSIKKA